MDIGNKDKHEYAHHGREARLFHKLFVYTCTHTWTGEDKLELSVLETANKKYDDDLEVFVHIPNAQTEVRMGEAFMLSWVDVDGMNMYAHLMRMLNGDIYDQIYARDNASARALNSTPAQIVPIQTINSRVLKHEPQ